MLETIENEQLKISISRIGGEMQSITGNDGTEYLWNGAPAYWKDRALNLFPYIGRLTNGMYQYAGQLYQLPIHGFLPTSTMIPVQQAPNAVAYTLRYNEQTLACYPFRFELQIVYTLTKNVLHVQYIVKNLDDKTMYFGIGGHPGFRVPMEQGKSFSDYRIAFEEKPEKILFSESCFCTGQREPLPLNIQNELELRHELFDQDAIITWYAGEKVRLYTPGGLHSVTVSAPQMRYWGFWHWPKTDAPYICIEPWSSLPSRDGIVEDLSKQEDLLSLYPAETYCNTWTITFDSAQK